MKAIITITVGIVFRFYIGVSFSPFAPSGALASYRDYTYAAYGHDIEVLKPSISVDLFYDQWWIQTCGRFASDNITDINNRFPVVDFRSDGSGKVCSHNLFDSQACNNRLSFPISVKHRMILCSRQGVWRSMAAITLIYSESKICCVII
ncbi:hypothetical protein QVD17_41560 [Tagetes erecta]|uniref:Uncharacterized protein n=1 Tax=Tagetes erecta TaxID=13708 RepID=A0AAD8JM22_TARER|nr:hypothetical protein QVD17_41560 [Tagetes erecta]